MAGSAEDFSEDRKRRVAFTFAALAGVGADRMEVSVESASVALTIQIAADNATQSSLIADSFALLLHDESVASTLLNLTVIAIPSISTTTVTRLVTAPSPPPPAHPPQSPQPSLLSVPGRALQPSAPPAPSTGVAATTSAVTISFSSSSSAWELAILVALSALFLVTCTTLVRGKWQLRIRASSAVAPSPPINPPPPTVVPSAKMSQAGLLSMEHGKVDTMVIRPRPNTPGTFEATTAGTLMQRNAKILLPPIGHPPSCLYPIRALEQDPHLPTLERDRYIPTLEQDPHLQTIEGDPTLPSPISAQDHSPISPTTHRPAPQLLISAHRPAPQMPILNSPATDASEEAVWDGNAHEDETPSSVHEGPLPPSSIHEGRLTALSHFLPWFPDSHHAAEFISMHTPLSDGDSSEGHMYAARPVAVLRNLADVVSKPVSVTDHISADHISNPIRQ